MDTLANPLTIDLKQQTDTLISQLPSGSKFSNLLASCNARSTLLSTLSTLLAEPSLTNAISEAFQPLLVDLCARWLQDEEDAERRFIALCLLIQPHEELFE
jgi:midasin